MKHLNLELEKLEQRIAPGGISTGCCGDGSKDGGSKDGGSKDCHQKGNNGFGNGGDDPAPGNSGTNAAPNADQKLEDVVR